MIPKFRAYSKQYGMREVVGLYWFDDHLQVSLANGVSTPIRTKDSQVKILRPTPFLDYNGDPIYEGHILTDEGNDWQDSWIYGVVYYDENERDWFVDWRSEGHIHPLASEPYRTIAGNIYENPELVEVD
ncbi:YopX family protein [Aerococcaceae bacterium NML190073]|nr:YopX family protein [Aerococcaceae bacterium NML190073]